MGARPPTHYPRSTEEVAGRRSAGVRSLRHVLPSLIATRYITPLREGGSLPAIVEANDDGTYVLKFRGAAQGLRVLVAEVIVARLARSLGLHVPDLAVIELRREIARYEADQEVQDLLTASIGSNLGVDFLPGALGYDGSQPADTDTAERIVWLDALTANVDRTWRNPNLLTWHGATWVIDHGAALYQHHAWETMAPDPIRFARTPFDVSTHVLGGLAPNVAARHDEFASRVSSALAPAVDEIPDEWFAPTPDLPDPAANRAAYVAMLTTRITSPDAWLPGAP